MHPVQTATSQDTDAAVERMWSDLDSVTDWIGAECFQAKPVNVAELHQRPVDDLTTQQLVAMLLDPYHNLHRAIAFELRDRYVDSHGPVLSARLGDVVAAKEAA